MVSVAELKTILAAGKVTEVRGNKAIAGEYQCLRNLNIYDDRQCEALATQAAAGRNLRILLPQWDLRGRGEEAGEQGAREQ